MSGRSLGNIGEAVARYALKKKNYRIIEQNFNTSAGEVDIIASTGGILVFIEVKTRTSDDFGSPSESINADKVSRIRKTASCYLSQKAAGEFQDCRFDVISVMIKRNILKNALRTFKLEKVIGKDISRISTAIINTCAIEHIEAAF